MIAFYCWTMNYNYNASSSTQTLKSSCGRQCDYVTTNSRHDCTLHTTAATINGGLTSSHRCICDKHWLITRHFTHINITWTLLRQSLQHWETLKRTLTGSTPFRRMPIPENPCNLLISPKRKYRWRQKGCIALMKGISAFGETGGHPLTGVLTEPNYATNALRDNVTLLLAMNPSQTIKKWTVSHKNVPLYFGLQLPCLLVHYITGQPRARLVTLGGVCHSVVCNTTSAWAWRWRHAACSLIIDPR